MGVDSCCAALRLRTATLRAVAGTEPRNGRKRGTGLAEVGQHPQLAGARPQAID